MADGRSKVVKPVKPVKSVTPPKLPVTRPGRTKTKKDWHKKFNKSIVYTEEKNQANISKISKNVRKKLSIKLSEKQIQQFVISLYNLLSEKFINFESVVIPNFGTFIIYQYPCRPGINIHTGERHEVRDINLIKFVPDAIFLKHYAEHKSKWASEKYWRRKRKTS